MAHPVVLQEGPQLGWQVVCLVEDIPLRRVLGLFMKHLAVVMSLLLSAGVGGGQPKLHLQQQHQQQQHKEALVSGRTEWEVCYSRL